MLQLMQLNNLDHHKIVDLEVLQIIDKKELVNQMKMPCLSLQKKIS
jgi:hypothetical protein